MLRLCLRLAFCGVCLLCRLAAFAQSAPDYAFSINGPQFPGGLFPFSLACDPAGNIYVSSLAVIDKLAPNGSYEASWGGEGVGPGQFSYPGGMAFDKQTNLYVADSYNDRIEKFDSNGRFVLAWGTHGTGPGQFDYPQGVAVDSYGTVYVADVYNNRVQLFAGGGVFLAQFQGAGAPAGPMENPWVLSLDLSNNLYVIDLPLGYTNYRVLRLDHGGGYVAEWPAYGVASANFSEIGGIATDLSNNVYVADAANNCVQKYSSEGTFLAEWGSLGSGPGQFNSASGIAIAPSGNYVYVSDYYNARIEAFAYSPAAPLIFLQPAAQSIPAGATLNLSAGVFGATPIAYQWRVNGTNITGATDITLQLTNAPLAASGSYSLLASNSFGATVSSDAAVAVMPVVVVTLPAGGISSTGAVLNGSVTTGPNASQAWFEWGTDTNYGAVIGFTNLNSYLSTMLQSQLAGLNGSIVYHYRLVSSNSLGAVFGQDVHFQVGLKPSLVTLPVTPVNSNTVVLNASVNPNGRETHAYFQLDYNLGSGYYTPTNDAGSGTAPVSFSGQVTGLRPGVIYYARAVATNDLGITVGANAGFIAPPWTLLNTPVLAYASVVCSADATRIFAAGLGQPHLSTNSSSSWSGTLLPVEAWQALSISADGTHLAGVAHVSGTPAGPAYFSTNSGTTWNSSSGPNRNWSSLASSGDGLKLAATDPVVGLILTSTNGGFTWATNHPGVAAPWSSIAISADGQKLLAAAGGIEGNTSGPLYTSTDAGLSWTSNNLPAAHWHDVASSATGEILAAAVGGYTSGALFVSTNGGASWYSAAVPSTNWQAITLSADGTTFAGVLRGFNGVMVSTNLGLNWRQYVLPETDYPSVAASADGATLLIAANANIYRLQLTPAPRLQLNRSGGQTFLSWTIPSLPFHLQQTSSLSSGQWRDMTNPAVLDAEEVQYRVGTALSVPFGFYRLAHP